VEDLHQLEVPGAQVLSLEEDATTIPMVNNFTNTHSLSVNSFMDTRSLISGKKKISKMGQKHLNINYRTVLPEIYIKWCNNSPLGNWRI